jgi:hypothetical protein
MRHDLILLFLNIKTWGKRSYVGCSSPKTVMQKLYADWRISRNKTLWRVGLGESIRTPPSWLLCHFLRYITFAYLWSKTQQDTHMDFVSAWNFRNSLCLVYLNEKLNLVTTMHFSKDLEYQQPSMYGLPFSKPSTGVSIVSSSSPSPSKHKITFKCLSASAHRNCKCDTCMNFCST